MPLLASPKSRDIFLRILSQVRDRYDFGLFGYVVMPEHIHLLISEPNTADPSMVMKVLKQRVSRALRRRKKSRTAAGQMRLWEEPVVRRHVRFWQRRYYDFNVWSERKRNEKMNYMHFNPVKRGLVASPKDWKWSSYRFYWQNEKGLCTPNPAWTDKSCRKPGSAQVDRNGDSIAAKSGETREKADQNPHVLKTKNVRHPIRGG